jgi:glycerate 2-kinase
LDPRNDALEIFAYALMASRVDEAVRHRIRFDGGVMEVDGHRYPLREYRRCIIIALGKAAGTLSAAFLQLAGRDAERFEGVVVSPIDEEPRFRKLSYRRGGHPFPDAGSLAAAREILEILTSLGAHDLVVFLISGGGSAVVERYIERETTLEAIVATHKALVECGAPIAAINAVRKHLSAVKGGRLAAAAAPAKQLTIFVSDVPPGELDALSSGPTVPDRSTIADVHRIVDQYKLQTRLPGEIPAMLLSGRLPETPKPGEGIFALSQWCVLLDSTALEHAAQEKAASLGWNAFIDHTCDDWSAEKAAEYLVGRVRELQAEHKPVCLVSAGEVTVEVPRDSAGIGGRNQHFALLASELIAGKSITVLSCGSDGIDGNSTAAGAIVDGRTLARASAVGFPVCRALQTFDSFTLLEKLGDTIRTGPTGNNLRDLRILLAH